MNLTESQAKIDQRVCVPRLCFNHRLQQGKRILNAIHSLQYERQLVCGCNRSGVKPVSLFENRNSLLVVARICQGFAHFHGNLRIPG